MGKAKVRALVLIGVLILVLGGAYLLLPMLNTETELPIPITPMRELPPDAYLFLDFAAEDQEGNPVYLSDFIDRPTIVFFWTSWCGFCKLGMDELQILYDQTGDEIRILAVNLSVMGNRRGELELGRAYMEEMGFSFSSIYDVQGEAERAYSVTGVPFTLFIGSDGLLYHSQLGMMNAEVLAYLVDYME